jgi:hypothetical protein
MRKVLTALMIMCSCAGVGSWQAQAFDTCNAQAERKWNGVIIEAFAQGDECANAVVTMVVRDKNGKPLWSRAHIVAQLLNFTDPAPSNSQAMFKNLRGWISGEGFMQSVENLNLKAEFPFTLSEQIDAKTFAAYRRQKRPIFCYIQGMESGNCLMIDKDGAVVDIGVQSFPG